MSLLYKVTVPGWNLTPDSMAVVPQSTKVARMAYLIAKGVRAMIDDALWLEVKDSELCPLIRVQFPSRLEGNRCDDWAVAWLGCRHAASEDNYILNGAVKNENPERKRDHFSTDAPVRPCWLAGSQVEAMHVMTARM